MKRLFLIPAIIVTLNAVDNTDLDNKFNELIQVRKTIDKTILSQISDPFYKAKIENAVAKAEISFTLYAIVDKRVKINEKWYGLNDEIGYGYKVVYVNNQKVGISNATTYKELNLKDNKHVKINIQ